MEKCTHGLAQSVRTEQVHATRIVAGHRGGEVHARPGNNHRVHARNKCTQLGLSPAIEEGKCTHGLATITECTHGTSARNSDCRRP